MRIRLVALLVAIVALLLSAEASWAANPRLTVGPPVTLPHRVYVSATVPQLSPTARDLPKTGFDVGAALALAAAMIAAGGAIWVALSAERGRP